MLILNFKQLNQTLQIQILIFLTIQEYIRSYTYVMKTCNYWQQLRNRIQTVKENQKVCMKFSEYLTRNLDSELLADQNKEYKRINEQKIERVSINYIARNIQPTNKPVIKEKNVINDGKDSLMKQYSQNKQDLLRKYMKPDCSSNFTQKIKQKRQPLEKQWNNIIVQNLNECQIFNSIQLYDLSQSQEETYQIHKSKTRIQDLNLQARHNQEYFKKEEEYFEIVIRKMDSQKSTIHHTQDHKSYLHQVKLSQIQTNLNNSTFNQNKNIMSIRNLNQNQLSSNQALQNNFNLSNFSSFNSKSLKKDQQISSFNFDKDFYQKQFVYLVKKIQMNQGKKLSQKGIQKIAFQLQQVVSNQFQDINEYKAGNLMNFEQNNVKQNILKQTQTSTNSKFRKMKDVTVNFINRKSPIKKIQKHKLCKEVFLSKQNNLIELTKSIKTKSIENQLQVSQKIKQNFSLKAEKSGKNPNYFIENTHQTNKLEKLKHNESFYSRKPRQLNQNTLKQFQKSTSSLTYKVIMQKKRNKNQRQQVLNKKPICLDKNFKQIGQHIGQNKEQNRGQKVCQDLLNNFNSLNKGTTSYYKNSLKIMIHSNKYNQKIKTLAFVFNLQQDKLEDKVQLFCLNNKISTTNQQSIVQAIQNKKSIISLKQ